MALINNWMELRSDAFKITVHARRPIPVRVESIGPWLECLTALVWVGAVINSALVYLFSPSAPISDDGSILFLYTILAALAASHGFIVVRGAIAHAVDRVCWRGSQEQIDSENVDKQVKDVCLKTLNGGELQEREPAVEGKETLDEFWQFDEGLEEIQKVLKEA
jgi:anoctamin-10